MFKIVSVMILLALVVVIVVMVEIVGRVQLEQTQYSHFSFYLETSSIPPFIVKNMKFNWCKLLCSLM